MKSPSASGAIPALPSSPATLTWISTSGAGCFSSWASAESDATEWIRRTRGATSRTLRLCSAPMKSQLNSSPCSACLSISSWARFSPTRAMPASARAGSSSAATYLIAAQISTSSGIAAGRGDRLPHPVEVLPDPRGVESGELRSSRQPREAGLAPGHAVVAAVGEEQLGLAAVHRSVSSIRSTPASRSLAAATALRSSMRPEATPSSSANASSTSGPTS